MAAAARTVDPATNGKAKKTAPPKTPNRTEPVDLAALATRVAKATRIKDATVELVQNGRLAVIVFDGRKLAYVSASARGIAVIVQDYGSERRMRFEPGDVKGAADAVKTSARRRAKPPAAKASAPKPPEPVEAAA